MTHASVFRARQRIAARTDAAVRRVRGLIERPRDTPDELEPFRALLADCAHFAEEHGIDWAAESQRALNTAQIERGLR
jgi:hypothetical protein